MTTREFYFMSRWTWYEWLGVFAPILLLWWFSKIGKQNGSSDLEKIGVATVYYGTFQLVVALTMMLPESLMRLRTLQPMRFLQILYLLLALLGGGLIGQKILRRRIYRWVVLFVPLCAGMFYAQCRLYPGTNHLEIPGRSPVNPWLQAFSWIKTNTPQDAFFALDPHYLQTPGEDYYGFRALSERSSMADAVKDTSVVTQVPPLAPEWKQETDAESGWKHFDKDDFERLRKDFGVTWAVVAEPGVAGMDCPYRNATVLVCKVN